MMRCSTAASDGKANLHQGDAAIREFSGLERRLHPLHTRDLASLWRVCLQIATKQVGDPRTGLRRVWIAA